MPFSTRILVVSGQQVRVSAHDGYLLLMSNNRTTLFKICYYITILPPFLLDFLSAADIYAFVLVI